jgi:hypothetical protein
MCFDEALFLVGFVDVCAELIQATGVIMETIPSEKNVVKS